MDEKGFTMVELLIVLAVLLILSGIGIPTYTVFRDRARESATEAEMLGIAKTLELYNTDNQAYPFTGNYPDALIDGNYIKSIPSKDAWNSSYEYTCRNGASYVLESFGLDKRDGGNDDIVFYNGSLIEGGAYPN